MAMMTPATTEVVSMAVLAPPVPFVGMASFLVGPTALVVVSDLVVVLATLVAHVVWSVVVTSDSRTVGFPWQM